MFIIQTGQNCYIMDNKKNINLIYWRCSQGQGNFGDELSKAIVDFLLNKDKYKLTCNKSLDEGYPNNFVALGSYIHGVPSKGTVWGTGLISEGGRFKRDIKVHSVRGPLTRDILIEQGVQCPEIYGDPALLLPNVYTPENYNFLNDKIALIPHWSQIGRWSGISDDKYHFINPTWQWKQVINEMCSCKAVVASSLHGLICADAYGIPNVRLTEVPLGRSHGGDFKFKDYYESQGRPFMELSRLEDFNEECLWKGGNKVDLDKLIDSFPYG